MAVWYAIHTFFVLQHAFSFAFVTCHLSCLLCVYLFHPIYLYDPCPKSPWFVSNIFFLQHLFVSIPLVFIRNHSIMVVWLIVNPCVLLNVSFLLFLSHVMHCVSLVCSQIFCLVAKNPFQAELFVCLLFVRCID